jgi:hypothetical protein
LVVHGAGERERLFLLSAMAIRNNNQIWTKFRPVICASLSSPDVRIWTCQAAEYSSMGRVRGDTVANAIYPGYHEL